MKQRNSLYALLLLLLVGGVLFAAAPFAQGEPAQQADPTDEQATINALVQERFNQTLEASGDPMTATAQAQIEATATAVIANATGTAAFQQTVDAVFAQALTATAQAASGTPVPDAGTPIPEVTEITADVAAGPIIDPAAADAPAVRVVLRVDGDYTPEQMDQMISIIRQRIDGLGIKGNVDPVEDRIRVEMAGVENLDEVVEFIQQPGLLEFVNFTGLMDQVSDLVGQDIATSFVPDRKNAMLNPLTNVPFETIVTGADVRNATAVMGLNSEWQVQFEFTEAAGSEMVKFTSEHSGEPLALVLDGRVLSIPVIQQEFGTAGAMISGGFTQQDAERLALQLNFGALPLDLTLVRIVALEELPIRGEAQPTEVTAGLTPTFGPTPTLDPRPTATIGQIQIVEQVFEKGRMFYIQPLDQIWVMEITEEGRGTWSIYQDTFEEGDPEFDPSLVADDGLYQPERGFGKLWRENTAVRDALGWGTTPEFGYISEYRYVPGGEVVAGQYTPGPGYHVLFSLYDEAFQFNELDNTWELHVDD